MSYGYDTFEDIPLENTMRRSNYAAISEFHYDPVKDRGHSILCCGQGCIIVFIIISMIFNAAGLYIGLTNQDAICYANENIISLSSWLILENSVGLFSGFLILIMLIVSMCGKYQTIYGIIFVCIISGMFFFSMTIIGIIELVYQYPTCSHEVSIVCGMIIASIVLNLY